MLRCLCTFYVSKHSQTLNLRLILFYAATHQHDQRFLHIQGYTWVCAFLWNRGALLWKTRTFLTPNRWFESPCSGIATGGVNGEGKVPPWQRNICNKNREKTGRKSGKIEKVLSLCPSWQIGLATLLPLLPNFTVISICLAQLRTSGSSPPTPLPKTVGVVSVCLLRTEQFDAKSVGKESNGIALRVKATNLSL